MYDFQLVSAIYHIILICILLGHYAAGPWSFEQVSS